MENSRRFKRDPFLLNLSKKTVIQYNKGFRACKKPSTILKTNEDLNHAYYTVFEYAKNMNNIIICEEDAEVLYYTKSHYDIVDNYISKDFSGVFSFASHGLFKNLDRNFFAVYSPSGAQANIYSKQERSKIMRNMESYNFKGHMDAHYLKDNTVVYKHPLIVQLFPETENFKNWGCNKYITRLAIKIIELDKKKSGWEILYILSKIRGQIYYNNMFLIFILSLLVLFIYRKKSILK